MRQEGVSAAAHAAFYFLAAPQGLDASHAHAAFAAPLPHPMRWSLPMP